MQSTPHITHPIASGFPSPAMEYQVPPLDLNRLLTPHPAATFFFRFTGHHGEKLGVRHGDLLIVDRSAPPLPGRMLLADRDGEWTLCLTPETTASGPPLLVWGVVTWVIHKL